MLSGIVVRSVASIILLFVSGVCLAQECPPERPLDNRRTVPIVDNTIIDIEVAGSQQPLLLFWDNLPANTPTDEDGTPSIVVRLADRVETYLNSITTAGLRAVRGADK